MAVYIAATEAERNDSPRERLDFRNTEFCFFTEDSSKFAFGNLPILKNPLKFSLFSFFSYICNSYIQKRNDN